MEAGDILSFEGYPERLAGARKNDRASTTR